jgi:hypothetical protein
MADVIEEKAPEMRRAGARLAWEVMDSMTFGLAGKAKSVIGSAFDGIGLNEGIVMSKLSDAKIKDLLSQKDLDAGARKLLEGEAAKRGLTKLGENMANLIRDGFKNGAKIKSPSRVFMELAGYLVDGLAIGIDKDTTAEASGFNWATRVKDAVQESISDLPNSLIDINPTITPVLDLSQVQSEASKLSRVFGANSVNANVSFGQANMLAQATIGQSTVQTNQTPVVKQVTFEQNNYAPTALSTADIYRQTKSQIALAKEELLV